MDAFADDRPSLVLLVPSITDFRRRQASCLACKSSRLGTDPDKPQPLAGGPRSIRCLVYSIDPRHHPSFSIHHVRPALA